MMNTQPLAIVCGNGINAHTIIYNLQTLNFAGRIVMLWHTSEGPGIVGCLNKKTEQQELTIDDPDQLPGWLVHSYGNSSPIYVLFTDERFHPAFAKWLAGHPASPIRCHLGSIVYMDAILDRYEFCSFISSRNLASVPRTIRGDEDPVSAFGNAFIVRPRMSWFGVAQRERVRLVHDKDSFDAAISYYHSKGLNRDQLSFQELLSIRNEANVSICGWYGPDKQHLYCTRKVLQWPPSTGGGDLVERLDPPDGLMEQAKAILDALAYDGPFELEFVFDEKAEAYKVIELNPRFWLQHGLIEALSGCALVSACVGQNPLAVAEKEQALRYWVNPLYSCSRGLKLDFLSLRCWLSAESWAPFGLRDAVRYGWHYCLNRMRGESVGR